MREEAGHWNVRISITVNHGFERIFGRQRVSTQLIWILAACACHLVAEKRETNQPGTQLSTSRFNNANTRRTPLLIGGLVAALIWIISKTRAFLAVASLTEHVVDSVESFIWDFKIFLGRGGGGGFRKKNEKLEKKLKNYLFKKKYNDNNIF